MKATRHYQSGFTQTAVILTVAAAIIILVPAIYFFAWRPSDSAIDTASANVVTIKSATSGTMKQKLDQLSYLGTVTDQTIAEFKSSVKAYQVAAASLENSPAVTRNGGAQTAYEKTRNAIASYGTELSSLASSVSLYGDIRSTCNKFMAGLPSIDTLDQFSSASADCTKAISNGELSTDKDFNEQFFVKYRANATALLTAIENYYTAVGNGNQKEISVAKGVVTGARYTMSSMGETVKYSLNAPDDSDLAALAAALAAEKASVLR